MTHIKFRSYLVSVVFICLISFPFLNGKLHFVKDIKSTENRKAFPQPLLNINLLDPFPEDYERYYNDTFNLRSVFVKYYNLLNINDFKRSPIPNLALIGSNGWLFMGNSELENYRNKDSLTVYQMQKITDILEYRKKYLNKLGCRFYFVLCPTKSTIYCEYMPPVIYRYTQKTKGEQLLEYLNKNSDIKPIDIFSTLRNNKDKGQLYYKLDNHWNELGAFYAAGKILKRIHEDMPEVDTLNINNFYIKTSKQGQGNISSMLSEYSFDSDLVYTLQPKDGFKSAEVHPAGYPIVDQFPPWDYEHDREIKDSKKPRLLLISDSYGQFIFPFLSEQFSRSVKIFDAWRYRLNSNIVKAEKPDVFILMLLEPFSINIDTYNGED